MESPEMSIHASSLKSMADEVLRGVSGAQIRKMVIPAQLIEMQSILATGDAERVSFLMRDVVGEGVSLAAGGSLHGGGAMEALSQAQSQCYVDMRAGYGIISQNDIPLLKRLIQKHQMRLIEWVDTGIIDCEKPGDASSHSDLTLIAQEFLTQPEVRKAAISIFVASTAMIEAGLTLFSTN